MRPKTDVHDTGRAGLLQWHINRAIDCEWPTMLGCGQHGAGAGAKRAWPDAVPERVL